MRHHATCHPSRLNYGHGLCTACYHKQWKSTRKATCHPDKEHKAKGLCANCYRRYLRSLRPDKPHGPTSLKRRHKMSEEEYQRKLSTQNNKCALCNEPPSGPYRLSVDHNHSCCPGINHCANCTRDLLCASCNVQLGMYEKFKDNPDLVARFEAYITKHTVV